MIATNPLGGDPPARNDMKTIAYVRVSTQEQAQHGFSLEAQTRRMEAYAVATDRVLDEVVVDDGRSAKSLDRPGMQRILDMVQSGEVGTVIIFKLDRLTRSVRDLDTIIELFRTKNVDLVSLSESLDTSSAGGRMMLNLLASVSQWEREVIGERTATVLTHRRNERKVYGPTPMGYDRIGEELVPNHGEQQVLADMRRMRNSGTSLADVARYLNGIGVPARQGGKMWYPASVSRVLSSKMNTEVA